MRARSISRSVLFLALVAGPAGASRPVKEFHGSEQRTAEEISADKARSKSSISDYGRNDAADPEPFPWMAVGFAAIALAVAAPFGLRYYFAVVRETANSRTTSPRRTVRDDLDNESS